MQKNKNNPANDEYEKHVVRSGGEYLVESSPRERLIAKILCVLAAIILWFYVVITDTATADKTFTDIGVQLRGLNEIAENLGLSVITGHDSTVDLTLLGTKSELNSLKLDDINAWVDLSEIDGSGEYTLEIKTSLPTGVSVGEMSANYVTIYVDRRLTVSLPIEVAPTFSIESSYTLGSPELSIDTVNVSGPAEELEMLDHAVVRLDLGRITKSVSATGTLELIDNNGSTVSNSRIRMQTSEVSVYYPVYTYKELPLAVSYKYNYYNSSNMQVQITPSTITVKGEPDVLEGMDSILLMQIDEKKITGDSSQSVTINIPGDVENVSGVRTAEVKLKHRGTSTRTMQVASLQVSNPNNLLYSIAANDLNVTFRGTQSLLSYLTPYNVTANIDLGYLNNASGTVEVPVSFTLSEDIAGSVYEIGDYKIQVTIGKN